MRILRILGSIVLWACAILGVAAGGVWAANRGGHLQSMVVISGSMEPGIMTGDLLLARPIAVNDVEVGDVLSLPSEYTGKLVTHRVVSIAALDVTAAAEAGVDLSGGSVFEIRMKGDANADADGEAYYATDEVLTPWVQIPKGGKVVSKLMEPSVALPVLLALIALLGLSLLDEQPRKVMRRVINRVRRDPRVDELDEDLAAVGVDVTHLQGMDDLDLKLFALGIDVGDLAAETLGERELLPAATAAKRNDRGVADGLWDFELPASDGVGLVAVPNHDPPTFAGSLDGGTDDHRSPSLSG